MIRRSPSLGGRLLSALVVAPLVTTSCAARVAFVPPTGPGAPAPDAATAWTAASAVCRSISSYRAELGLTGQVGDRRIRGLASARLHIAVTAQGSLGLDATVSGQLLFRLGGSVDSAVLLLRDPDRVVTARPEEILDALVGVRLGPDRLLPIFAGCVSTSARVARAADHGRILEIATDDARVFLERSAGAWQTRAGRFETLSVEYGAFSGGVPRDIFVRSTSDGPAVSLELGVRNVAINTDIAPAAFRVNLPAGATTISLEELRQTGPLMGEGAGR